MNRSGSSAIWSLAQLFARFCERFPIAKWYNRRKFPVQLESKRFLYKIWICAKLYRLYLLLRGTCLYFRTGQSANKEMRPPRNAYTEIGEETVTLF